MSNEHIMILAFLDDLLWTIGVIATFVVCKLILDYLYDMRK